MSKLIGVWTGIILTFIGIIYSGTRHKSNIIRSLDNERKMKINSLADWLISCGLAKNFWMFIENKHILTVMNELNLKITDNYDDFKSNSIKLLDIAGIPKAQYEKDIITLDKKVHIWPKQKNMKREEYIDIFVLFIVDMALLTLATKDDIPVIYWFGGAMDWITLCEHASNIVKNYDNKPEALMEFTEKKEPDYKSFFWHILITDDHYKEVKEQNLQCKDIFFVLHRFFNYTIDSKFTDSNKKRSGMALLIELHLHLQRLNRYIK